MDRISSAQCLWSTTALVVYNSSKRASMISRSLSGLRRLTDNAYPNMAEEARNQITRNYFMRNIRKSKIRSTLHLSQPKSMEAALQTAVEMEACLASEKKLREQPSLVWSQVLNMIRW